MRNVTIPFPLQDIATDRDCWYQNAGAHYRGGAHWLRGVAAKATVRSESYQASLPAA
jgi:hypothetical protein